MIVAEGEPCDCSSKVAYGIQCRHDLAINRVFDFGKFKDPERWKLRLIESSSDTGSFICQSLHNVGKLHSNGSNAEFDNDDNRASGQVVVLDDEDNDVDGLSCNDEPGSTEIESSPGPNEEPTAQDTNNTREDIEPMAQLANTKSISFKNFMDYCHNFASAV